MQIAMMRPRVPVPTRLRHPHHPPNLKKINAPIGIGSGPRLHEVCPFSAVNHSYAATGNGALEAAISAGYKQVFGNIGITSNQRLASEVDFQHDGRTSVRDFMARLMKSELYKKKFFHAVSPILGVELTMKHLLGRPPIS